ncbi:MAG: OmpA family protein [Leptospiraceae bacterium]|nr:OmpA family protein [Leptospiraceae bacterium]MDW7975600.1 OmpA family protein [Leptospiraceae bacterium]
MKVFKITTIFMILSFVWVLSCATGQTTQQTEQPKTDTTAQERNLRPFEVGKDLGFVYAPYGKGWNYKDVRLDSADFNKWYNQNKDRFMQVVNNLGDNLVLEIVGHTDESGPREAQPELGKKGNVWYSTQRAQRVYDALVKAGISANKLKVRGAAEDELIPGIDPYDQRHRRVTFRVVNK